MPHDLIDPGNYVGAGTTRELGRSVYRALPVSDDATQEQPAEVVEVIEIDVADTVVVV